MQLVGRDRGTENAGGLKRAQSAPGMAHVAGHLARDFLTGIVEIVPLGFGADRCVDAPLQQRTRQNLQVWIRARIGGFPEFFESRSSLCADVRP